LSNFGGARENVTKAVERLGYQQLKAEGIGGVLISSGKCSKPIADSAKTVSEPSEQLYETALPDLSVCLIPE
jgi:hypothetical protein